MPRFALRRLLDFRMGPRCMRAPYRSRMRLTRVGRMRAMMNHRFVSFGFGPHNE
jgi:hypothetical protein